MSISTKSLFAVTVFAVLSVVNGQALTGWGLEWFEKSTVAPPSVSSVTLLRSYGTTQQQNLDFPAMDQAPNLATNKARGVFPTTMTSYENFVVKAAATCIMPGQGTYNLNIYCDDGCSLLLNGAEAYPTAWKLQARTKYTKVITVTDNQPLDMYIQLYEHTGVAHLELKYEKYNGNSGTVQAEQYVGGSMCSPKVTSSVSFDGMEFAVLDATSPTNSTTSGCQTAKLPLPIGWAVAEDTPQARAVAHMYPFGTSCLALSSGDSLLANWGGSSTSPQYCRKDAGVSAIDSGIVNGATVYVPSAATVVSGKCSTRVLIARAMVSASDTALGSLAAGGVRSLLFDGERFASLQGFNPDNATPGSCSTPLLYKVPTGWFISPGDTKARAALLGVGSTFGAACHVFADGTSYSSTTAGGACAAAPGTKNLLTYDGYVKASMCGLSVVIRAATLPTTGTTFTTTWTSVGAEPTAANQVTIKAANVFATLNNTSPTQAGVLSCHSRAVSLPTNWAVVADTTQVHLPFLIPAVNFAANCLATAKGGLVARSADMKPCSAGIVSSVHNGKTYYAATACPVQILISKAAPTPVSTAKCGTCTAWGDPHFTSFDGIHYNFYGTGEYWVSKPITGTASLDNWYVRSFQEKVKTAAKHSVITIGYSTTVLAIAVDRVATKPVPPTFTVNNVTLTIAAGASSTIPTVNIVVARTDGNSYTVTLPNAVVVTVKAGFWNLNLLDLTLTVPNTYRGKTVGLCGSCDGNPDNDFTVPDCSIMPRGSAAKDYDFGLRWAVGAASAVGACNGVVNTKPDVTDRGTPEKETPIKEGDDPIDHCEDAPTAVRLAASNACDGIINAALKAICYVDICVTKDKTIGDTTKDVVNQVIEDVVGATTCSAGVAAITMPTASLHGRTYALLDNWNPADEVVGCQAGSLRVPTGWRLADDTPVNRAALACYPWGASCIVMSNGRSYTPTLTACGQGELVTQTASSGTYKGQQCHSVSTCSRRVLIVKDPTAVIVNPTSAAFRTGHSWMRLGDYTTGYPNPTPFTLEFPNAAGAPDTLTLPPTAAKRDLTAGTIRLGGSTGVTNSDGGVIYPARFSTDPLSPVAMRESFRISVWSRAVNADVGLIPSDYSLYVDVVLTDGSSVRGSLIAPFREGTHDWEQVFLDVDVAAIIAKRTGNPAVNTVEIYLLFRNAKGTAWFSDLVIEPISGLQDNLLRQATMDAADMSEWLSLGEGYTWDRTLTGNQVSGPGTWDATGSIKLSRASATSGTSGAYQGVDLVANPSPNPATMTALYIGGWSKVSGNFNQSFAPLSSYYSLYWDAKFTDDTFEYGNFEPFPGSGAWEVADRVWKPASSTKALKSVTLNTILRNQAGTANFDGLVMLWTCPRGARSTPANGFSHGDPHVVSMDGARYDVHRIGEFLLVGDALAQVQVRHSIAGKASVNSAFAISLVTENEGLKTVQVDRAAVAGQDPVLRVNGLPVAYSSPSSIRISDSASVAIAGTIATSTLTFRVTFSTRTTGYSKLENDVKNLMYSFTITAHATDLGTQFLQVFTSFPEEARGAIVGLMGNWNDDKTDDWRLPDGTVATDVNTFADSWMLSSDTSVFAHEQGVTAESLRDPTFVPSVLTAYPAASVEAARASCARAGVSADFVDDCAFDTLAHSASHQTVGYTAVSQHVRASEPVQDTVARESSGTSTGPLAALANLSTGNKVALIAGIAAGVLLAIALALIACKRKGKINQIVRSGSPTPGTARRKDSIAEEKKKAVAAMAQLVVNPAQDKAVRKQGSLPSLPALIATPATGAEVQAPGPIRGGRLPPIQTAQVQSAQTQLNSSPSTQRAALTTPTTRRSNNKAKNAGSD